MRTFVVVSGTLPDSIPPVISNPPMVILIICPLTLLASISIFLFSLGLASDDDHDIDGDNIRQLLDKWDCSLHLPLWVSNTEKASIEARLDEWTRQLDESGADIASLASCLKKPLRPLWVSQKTVIWLNEVPEHDSWDFTPLILVSASASGELLHRTNSELSWNYIPGAGDDEESWARGLSPNVFWTHVIE